VKGGKAKTKLDENEDNKILFELIARAEKWLNENRYPNEIRKWETEVWGEIPADFGRK
jgi:ribonuclease HI